jgi:hypothetical protein
VEAGDWGHFWGCALAYVIYVMGLSGFLGLLGWGCAFTSEGYSFVFKGIIWEERGGVELEEKVAS